jgi:A/G-specific adenine glycosylase
MAPARKRSDAPPLVATPKRRVTSLRAKLLAWYDANKRDLPWRRSRDPYAIWISETMLQQTRVETVIPYYARFLERFPDVEALASADRDDVLQHWAGLGYYSRARNLHDAARSVVDDFAGELPRDADALKSLPGIGRYTAGAVASIAFDRPEAIVDGNVARVLARVLGIREDIGDNAVKEFIWQEAAAIAQGERPGDLNQALMELGATCCTPRTPDCDVCPWRASCNGRRVGDAATLPIKAKKKKPRPIFATAAWLPRNDKILAVRRPEKGLLASMWELPGGELAAGADPAAEVAGILSQNIGLSPVGLEGVGEVEHIFTHLRLRLHVFRCKEVRGRVRLREHAEHRWLAPDRFDGLPYAAITRKALALLR